MSAGIVCQSEYGDMYKATLTFKSEGDMELVSELKIKYFDTIPPCVSICVLKTGFLFAGSEFGNHTLYQFQVGTPYRTDDARDRRGERCR